MPAIPRERHEKWRESSTKLTDALLALRKNATDVLNVLAATIEPKATARFTLRDIYWPGSPVPKELASLAPFAADGLVKCNADGLEVTDVGRLFIRNIAMCFDNTLAPVGERRHSRTI